MSEHKYREKRASQINTKRWTFILLGFFVVSLSAVLGILLTDQGKALMYRLGDSIGIHKLRVMDDDRGIKPEKLESLLRAQDASKGKSKKYLYTEHATYTPQYVLLSFDGSKSVVMWEETRAFAEQMRKEGKPLSFTYFINGVYFISKGNRNVYVAPNGRVGASMINFSDSQDDIGPRIDAINRVIADGHEIGSHAAGHYDGSEWTEEMWMHEFSEQNKLLFNIRENNTNEALPVLNLAQKDIVGFRAPELGVNKNLFTVLASSSFAYDTSGVAFMSDYPYKDKAGLWRIPLVTIPFGEHKRSVLSMDYSIWMHQSRAEDIVVKGTPQWDTFYKETYDAYMNYFEKNYKGRRAPVVIGHHFSLWNDGVYWEALKSFAESVCGMPEVRCTTMREYVAYREKTSLTP